MAFTIGALDWHPGIKFLHDPSLFQIHNRFILHKKMSNTTMYSSSSTGRIKPHPKVHKINIKISKLSTARRLYENLESKELEKLLTQTSTESEVTGPQRNDRKMPPASQVTVEFTVALSY